MISDNFFYSRSISSYGVRSKIEVIAILAKCPPSHSHDLTKSTVWPPIQNPRVQN